MTQLLCLYGSGYIVTSGHNTMGSRITNSLEKWSTYKCASGLGKVYDIHHTTRVIKGIYPPVVFYLYWPRQCLIHTFWEHVVTPWLSALIYSCDLQEPYLNTYIEVWVVQYKLNIGWLELVTTLAAGMCGCIATYQVTDKVKFNCTVKLSGGVSATLSVVFSTFCPVHVQYCIDKFLNDCTFWIKFAIG